MMIASFVWLATIIFGLLFVIWDKKDWFNFFIKVVFFVVTIQGIIILVEQKGFSSIILS